MSDLNRVGLSCCWVGVGLGCDNICIYTEFWSKLAICTEFNSNPIFDATKGSDDSKL